MRGPEANHGSKEKRIMSKSAQKYRKKGSDEPLEVNNSQCANCPKYK
jgi:hypothetical protein